MESIGVCSLASAKSPSSIRSRSSFTPDWFATPVSGPPGGVKRSQPLLPAIALC
jgi:hypothetical protein